MAGSTCTHLYANKVMLAPMVRIGTLPSRLLSLRYGADLAYTEEMIDFKMLRTKRVVNELLGTVDFVMDDGTVTFRTCGEEKDRLIFQIGTSHPKRALKVAKMVENDVAGIDINMGCPKTFSISGGMGAALLKQPELVKQILTELTSNLSIPVTCKIRCLSSVEETINFCKMLQSTGISAVAVHGRTREERPRHKCKHGYIQQISQALDIPVIANGGSSEIKQYCDIENFKVACGASSVMVARSAEWNVSIFRSSGPIDKQELIKEYLTIAVDYDNHWTNTKYCIQQILGSEVQSEEGTRLLASKCPEDIYAVYGMMDYFNQVNEGHELHLSRQKEIEERDYDTIKGLKVKVVRDEISGRVVSYESNHVYNRKVSHENQTPKMFLYTHMRKLHGADKSKLPTFICEAESDSRRFRCTMGYEGVSYISDQWHKRKMWAEQAACQIYMQLNDMQIPITEVSEVKQQVTADNRCLLLKMDNTDVQVTVISNTDTCSDNNILGYSTTHCFTSEGSSEGSSEEGAHNSPMKVLCLHLLKQRQEEPEYDIMMDGEGEVTHSTLRHGGIEYTNICRYTTRKDAINAVCLLYLLINKISTYSSTRPANSGEKRKVDDDTVAPQTVSQCKTSKS